MFMQRRLSLFSVLLFVTLLITTACGSGGTSPTPEPIPAVRVSITPANTNLLVRTSTTFSATVTGNSNQAVNYTVMQGAGGGSILNTGEYLAPITPGTYTVRATSAADPSKFADATVTVRDYSGNFTRTNPPDGYDYHTASL